MPRRKLTQPTLKPYSDPDRPEYKWRVFYNKAGGKRTSSVFKSKQEANNFLEDKKVEAVNLGGEIAATLSDDIKRSVFESLKKLEPYGKSIDDAVDFYVDHLKATKQSRPVGELVDDFIVEMERAKKSYRYVVDLKNRLDKFVQDHRHIYANQIPPRRAQLWLNRLKVSELTRNHYRRVLSAFFAWCERQGYVQQNVISKTEKAKVQSGEIEFFAVSDLRVVLDYAASLEKKDILAMCCIGAFAGLRASECERLDWTDVQLNKGIINLSKSKTKTAARRVVDIRPTLRAWIELYFRNANGPIRQPDYVGRLREFRLSLQAGDKSTGRPPVNWPHNGLRHSYASYLLAETEKPGFVSLQLGHNDSGLLFAHYRELASREESKAYWNLLPKSK